MICGIGNGNETGTRGRSGAEDRICIAPVPALVLVLVRTLAKIRIDQEAMIRTDLEDMIGIGQTTIQALLDSIMSIPGIRTIGPPRLPLLGYLPRSH